MSAQELVGTRRDVTWALQGTSGLEPATGMWLSRQQGWQSGFSLMVTLPGDCEKEKKKTSDCHKLPWGRPDKDLPRPKYLSSLIRN